VHIYILIFIIVFLYGAFSTTFHSTEMVGEVGKMFGEGNLKLFGYLAYVDLLALIYPLYLLYKNNRLFKELEFHVGWVLLFTSFLLLQPLVVDIYRTGTIGLIFYDFLIPLIGKVGTWLLWLLSFTLSLVLILNEVPDINKFTKRVIKYKNLLMEKFRIFYNYLMTKIENPFFDEESTESMTTIVAQRRVRKMNNSHRVKQKTPRKLTHKKRTLKKKEKVDEIPMLEERPLDEIGNMHIEHFSEPIQEVESEIVIEPKVIKVQEQKKEKKQKKEIPKEKIQKEHESTAKIIDELKQNRELMEQLEKGEIEEPEDFELPPLEFLAEAPKVSRKINEEEIDRKVHELLNKLGQFKISGEVMDIYSGPLVTTFEFKPAANVKVSKILNLQDDLAMALRAETIRIQAPIPGRDVVGIEIPNETFDTIYLRDILESELFLTSKSPLTIAMGKDIVGNPFITDLKKLPHLLIAGTTGSGKSVGINAMILSLLYRNDPDSLKLMLIDPKMLEFSIYNDIPHLITPVITDATKAIAALANMVGEMERRYKLMAESRTKNIDNYNEKAKKKGVEPMPFIVVIIDELADLMMLAADEVERYITRIAQMARATGIHLIIATQRPSTDVVTGLIKANFPARIAFAVSSQIDSRVILDSPGAEKLLGKGDMLYMAPDSPKLARLQGCFVSDAEIKNVVAYWKRAGAMTASNPAADDTAENNAAQPLPWAGILEEANKDNMLQQAIQLVIEQQRASATFLQRKLGIGYPRASRLMDQLEEEGVIGPAQGGSAREVLWQDDAADTE